MGLVSRTTAADECSVRHVQYAHHIYFPSTFGVSATEEDKFRNVHVWHTIIGMITFTLLVIV